MPYGSISLEKRIKENIKNYTLGQLLDLPTVQKELEGIWKLTGAEFLLTRRHGEAAVIVGEWGEETVDVEANPGRKVRVSGRTIGHFYSRYSQQENQEVVEELIESLITDWEAWGEKSYLYEETDQYVYESLALEEQKENEKRSGAKLDPLTETLNHTYFDNRMRVMDRSQVVPVAAVCANINDWKFVNDNYGDEESDRLIVVIADILKKFAKPEYIVGRVDGDVFNIVIPMPEDGEAEEYMRAVQEACKEYEDPRLAPSVAVGMAMKTNVEEYLVQVFSDAEYEMFENKMMLKQEAGYQERLKKGL